MHKVLAYSTYSLTVSVGGKITSLNTNFLLLVAERSSYQLQRQASYTAVEVRTQTAQLLGIAFPEDRMIYVVL